LTTGLVHDHLLVMRGAERTFAAIADIWPEAPLYTVVYDAGTTEGRFAGRDVRSALLRGSPVRQRGIRRLRRLFPWAVRRLPMHEHEIVISSSTGFALGVRPRIDAIHVCYCHSPFRDAWQDRDEALARISRFARPAARLGFRALRRADRRASTRVTDFVANSNITRRRIEEFFGRDATVIHPPVEVERFAPRDPEDYFVVVAELVPHKRVDVALEAAKLAGKRVTVVGSGPEYRRLNATFGSDVEFVRRLSDDELAELVSGAQALIVANIEDFGIAAVEVQAAGRPVLGIDAGGLQETVVQGQTGILVDAPTAEALADALRSVDFTAFDTGAIRDHAQQFSVERFQRELGRHVDRVVAHGQLVADADPVVR
jgi:glycosyltransferase involved in cell wall biosynthesis